VEEDVDGEHDVVQARRMPRVERRQRIPFPTRAVSLALLDRERARVDPVDVMAERRHRPREVPLAAAGVEYPQRRRREPLVTDDVDEPPEPQRVEDLIRRVVERHVAAGEQLPAQAVAAVPEVDGFLDHEPLGVGHGAPRVVTAAGRLTLAVT
jgi:hypothetical protein